MKYFTFIALLLFLVSCEKDVFFESDYSIYKSEQSLNSDIEFFPSEICTSKNEKEPILTFQFYTTDSYPCINYFIQTSTFEEGDELIVRFEGVSIGDICFTAVGPASTQVEVPENIEKLILISGDKIDIYRVKISNDFVELKNLSRSFTRLRYTKIFRFPENSFEYSCPNNENQLVLYYEFLDSLKNTMNFTEFHFDGEGIIPYTANSDEELAKYFVYKKETDFEAAGELFLKFINENSEKEDYIYIKLITWKGEKYLSWMLYD